MKPLLATVLITVSIITLTSTILDVEPPKGDTEVISDLMTDLKAKDNGSKFMKGCQGDYIMAEDSSCVPTSFYGGGFE